MIKLIITDFDGTLFNTFEANFLAYKEVLKNLHYNLDIETYRNLFGFRFDDFMKHLGIESNEEKQKIRELKKKVYPKYFNHIQPNEALVTLLKTLKDKGIKIAIASTARKENLMNVLSYFDKRFNLLDLFDYVITGEDVTHGKPNPEVYNFTMSLANTLPSDTLVFEDSDVGITAAKNANTNVIKINMN